MLPSYFDCIFVHLRQKVRLRPELSPKFLSTLSPDRTRPEKLGPTYNSALSIPVLGLDSVCLWKGCPWPWPRIFLCSWTWPQALCPRLHF